MKRQFPGLLSNQGFDLNMASSFPGLSSTLHGRHVPIFAVSLTTSLQRGPPDLSNGGSPCCQSRDSASFTEFISVDKIELFVNQVMIYLPLQTVTSMER